MKATLLVVIFFLVPSMGQGPKDSYVYGKLICLDGVLPQRVVLPDKSLGPETLSSGTGECMQFAVQLPLTSEDAQLLEGKLPEDDASLHIMSIEWGNAQTFLIASMMESDAESKANNSRAINQIRQAFSEARKAFCARHPSMFVLEINPDGSKTIPQPCLANGQ
ncbi:MAG TPA: hypothetical protein VJR23_15225 [Candidatus Acidoferrales bacterium]|nr:hypothetical protein [Candidatus Acidoferrales bacterium]